MGSTYLIMSFYSNTNQCSLEWNKDTIEISFWRDGMCG